MNIYMDTDMEIRDMTALLEIEDMDLDTTVLSVSCNFIFIINILY